MRKHLSTSIYTFRDIINENCMYIDKTADIWKLVSKPKGQFFLSRPRRFGKSLTLSTLEAIFLGKKELFIDLYIYDQPYEWKSYPIIRLALNKLSSDSAKELDTNFCFELKNIANQYNLQLETGSSSQQFKELITKLYKQSGLVVILIDEYDKPILDNILENAEVANIRALLKRFYGIIKASEEYIRFTFITGVSKFTQVSIFSDLNNLTDISMLDDFATLCGFTREECELYFEQWIDENAVKNEMTRDTYLLKLKKNYNGFRFSQKGTFVYNPVSYTNAMEYGDFKHYWFETGTPTFLLKILREKNYDIPEFENLILKSSVFSSYEIESLQLEALLYQTGYLTIKDYDKESDLYTLSYPNEEVRQSFLERLTSYFTPVGIEKAPALIEELRNAMLANDMDEIFEILQLFYAKIDNSIKIK